MKKNKSKITHQLKKSRGFGSLKIYQRLPKKPRRICSTTKQQLKAIRGTMDMDRIEMREELVILLMTEEEEIIAGVPLYRGTSDQVGHDIRDIIQLAAIAKAYHIVVAHNHPNGHTQPSDADTDTAYTYTQALRISGFNLLDFYVVTRKKHFSFADNGLLRS
jgi:DNA repair protein RadC